MKMKVEFKGLKLFEFMNLKSEFRIDNLKINS